MASERDLDFPVVQPLSAEKPARSSVKVTEANSGAKCAQCGQTIRHMPIFLKNITCRDCYGTERYRPSSLNTSVPSLVVATPAPDEIVTV